MTKQADTNRDSESDHKSVKSEKKMKSGYIGASNMQIRLFVSAPQSSADQQPSSLRCGRRVAKVKVGAVL